LLLVALAGVYFLVVTPLVDLYAERQAVLENRRMLLLACKLSPRNYPDCA